MIDFTLFDKALKICWVRRLFSEGSQLSWKLIPFRYLSNVGVTFLFQCNFDVKHLNLNQKLPTFYKDIISHWQELNNAVPRTKKDVLDQIVWNINRFVKIDKASVYFRSWHLAGVYKLQSPRGKSKSISIF